MPSVGPELPPHLAKRKRSIDEDEGPNSPPRKLQAASLRTAGPTLPAENPDEVDIDDESEDDYGPSIPTANGTKAIVGPTLPPAKNPDEVNLDDSSEDGYGVSIPATKAAAGPTLPSSKNPDELDAGESSEGDSYGPSAVKPAQASKPSVGPSLPPKRILGPAPPPANLSEMPFHPAKDSSDSSDDDDYGPSLPPVPGSAAASLLHSQQEEEYNARFTASSTPAKPQRAEWMLAPPSDSDWTSRIDPTKLKNRKFASGKGAKAPAAKSGVSAIWTETPEEKRQRLEDEVMGRSEGISAASKTNKAPRGEDREQAETERRIREYNEKNRGRSLMEERRAAQERGALEKEEEDDPSKRGFDREKDMALGGRMGEAKKREMLGRAADFGSRFQRGKYL